MTKTDNYIKSKNLKMSESPSVYTISRFKDKLTFQSVALELTTKCTRWDIITGPLTQHNLVNIRFGYMKISGTVAEGMLSLQIWN